MQQIDAVGELAKKAHQSAGQKTIERIAPRNQAKGDRGQNDLHVPEGRVVVPHDHIDAEEYDSAAGPMRRNHPEKLRPHEEGCEYSSGKEFQEVRTVDHQKRTARNG